MNIKIPEEEARYLFNRLIDDNVVRKIIAGNRDEVICIEYIHETQLFHDKGGYKTFELKKKISEDEKSKIQVIEKNKLIKEAKLADWQVKIFWPLFIIALIGGLCGIISLLLQIINNSSV